MSTTTPNLGLFKYDVKEDGILTFSITRALNNNWDIIDNAMNTPPSITIDDALSTTSENPVQNKVITNVISNKIDKVTSVGNTAKPIYVNSSGNLTACSASLGNSSTPIYMSGGQFYQCSSSIPSTTGITASFSSNINGYCKFSNGFCIQWLQVNNNTSGNFPTTFNSIYSCVIVEESSQNGYRNLKSISSSGFTAGGSATKLYAIATGYKS